MELLDAPLHDLPWYDAARKMLQKKDAKLRISGSADSHKLHLISALGRGLGRTLIVTYSDRRAREIREEYLFYDPEALVYPAKDLIFYQADINGRETETERVRVLHRLVSGASGAVVTTIDALLGDCIPARVVREHILKFRQGDTLDLQKAAFMLTEMGYEKSYQVELPGQYAVHGGILDVYGMTEENPVRVELWGDVIDSLRAFDVGSQRTVEALTEATIYPATEMILSERQRREGYRRIAQEAEPQIQKLYDLNRPEDAFRCKTQLGDLENLLLHHSGTVNLESYLHYFYEETETFLQLFTAQGEACVFLDEPARLMEHVDGVIKEFRESMSHRLEKGYVLPGQTRLLRESAQMLEELSHLRSVQLSALEDAEGMLGQEARFRIMARTLASYNGSFSTLIEQLKRQKSEGERIVILSASRSRAKNLAEELTEQGVVAYYTEDAESALRPGEVVTYYGRVRKGYAYPEAHFMLITETDIFGAEHKSRRKRPKYSGGTRIASLADLHVGDYVIHEDSGLGVYRGIEEIELENVRKDYMKIEYRDGGTLYVLATGFDKVQFYADKDAKPPKLNKLGTQEWTRTKAKVRASVATVAKDLVDLYAQRSRQTGYVYGPDTVWQQEFEERFPYEETEDQLRAIEATKSDMESAKIMDRLICGDVGFGKTEVAIRAAFKAVLEGKQVAYLVPTTILAEQHYHTFRERMEAYPVRIEMLSRFRSAAEIRATLSDLKKGYVDIVIGTHRLLSKDVGYKDLGLLIIDEEQRFGVSHKERIKQIRQNVDVLTLTATPIPRTLHMSLVGIRDMSLLEEPPRNRLPIQTYVCEYDEEMVREAIRREVNRSGQVYYVYNRVDSIQDVADMISRLVPEARVAYAHGQMQERELEDIMMSFIRQEIDVLVATTIIETGLDIPNVNTMIIHDSDRMGLSQLYQLRGRVGRSDRTSYAFLMYRRDKVLREVAEKRLTAIREFTELGSGFKIAMRDLEIRGAGTLLGKEQHGHIESIGYDLYCRMLEAAVREEQGIAPERSDSCAIDLDVDAYLPPEYIMNEIQKLDVYRRISMISSSEDADEMRDELRDRFGALPPEADVLIRIATLQARARSCHMTEIRGRAGKIRFVFAQDAPLDVSRIPELINDYRGALRMKGLEFHYLYQPVGLVGKEAALLLSETERVVESFAGLRMEKEGV